MIATVIIELCLLVWILARKALKQRQGRIIALVLLMLAVFQFAEYNICGRLGLHGYQWAEIGFMSITLLPPLGVHLISTYNDKLTRSWKAVVILAYANAALWLGMFALGGIITGESCGGNYAIFDIRDPATTFYTLYYYLWLGIAVVMAYLLNKRTLEKRRQLEWFIIGYATFLIPTGITALVRPAALRGVPSIMCGFAVIYAFILAFKVFDKSAK